MARGSVRPRCWRLTGFVPPIKEGARAPAFLNPRTRPPPPLRPPAAPGPCRATPCSSAAVRTDVTPFPPFRHPVSTLPSFRSHPSVTPFPPFRHPVPTLPSPRSYPSVIPFPPFRHPGLDPGSRSAGVGATTITGGARWTEPRNEHSRPAGSSLEQPPGSATSTGGVTEGAGGSVAGRLHYWTPGQACPGLDPGPGVTGRWGRDDGRWNRDDGRCAGMASGRPGMTVGVPGYRR